MGRLGGFEVHPFADEFPLVEGEEFDELVRSVKEHGLREPIVVSHDRTVLIDGRNRFRACEAAGVDAVFEALPERYTEAMILDFIADKNIHTRHLSAGQRALVAVAYERRYAEATKTGRPGYTPEQIANGERETSADRHQLFTDGDDPAQRGTDGRGLPITGSEITEITHAVTSYQRRSATKAAKKVGASGRAVARAKAVERDAPDLADDVRKGTLTLDKAYKQTRDRERAKPKPEPVEQRDPRDAQPITITLHTHTGQEIHYPQPKTKPRFNETTGEGISWAAWSWNPVTGCLHGCEYCYAREIATNERYKASYPAGFTPLFHSERLDAPTNTTIPAAHKGDPAYKRVFVCSMADLYGRWVPDEWIAQVHESMLKAQWWQYILLTKFPARYVGLDLPPKAWVGTSVDEQRRVRIAEDAFRQIDAPVKWLSLEPLREPLVFTDLSMFDWVVIGAQTVTRQEKGVIPAFSPPAEWVVRITQQALDAGCRVHWKPNLRNNPGMQWLDQYPEM